MEQFETIRAIRGLTNLRRFGILGATSK